MNRENTFIFSSKSTQIAKGLAILLMVMHHLFAFPERIKNVSYQSIVHMNGIPIEQEIGEFGKLCVAMFLFLSGYGLYKVYQKKQHFTLRDSIRRAGKFLKYYYIIFLIFIPIGFIFFQSNPDFHWDTAVFFYNLFALDATYNGEWWFVPLYVQLVILFPFILKGINKNPVLVTYLAFIGFYFANFFIGLIDYFPNHELIMIFLEHIGNLLGWQLAFMTGIFCAKFLLFEKTDMYLKKFHLDNIFFHLLVIFICYYGRQYILEEIIKIGNISFEYNNYNIVDFIIAPMVIFSFVKIASRVKLLEVVFRILGKHSTVIWLTHSFFCYHYFQEFTYAPKYSIAILLWVLMITIGISIVIDKLLTSRPHIIPRHALENSH